MCYSGFYIKGDSLILFMTGGKIMFGLMNKDMVTRGSIDLMLKFLEYISRNTTSRREGIINMIHKRNEEVYIMRTGITIQNGTLIITTIFTMCTRTSTNMDEPRALVSCSRFTSIKDRMAMLATADAERKGKP